MGRTSHLHGRTHTWATGVAGRKSLGDGFWERVERGSPDDCWPWMGSLKDTGYGQLTRLAISSTPLKAHRVAWELVNGPIPAGLHCLHRCDNRRCVNPAHLFLGTNHDNIKDMWSKGRGRTPNMTEASY